MSETSYHPPRRSSVTVGSLSPDPLYVSVPIDELGLPSVNGGASASRTTISEGLAIDRGCTPPPNKEEQKALRSNLGIDWYAMRHPESWRDVVPIPLVVLAFVATTLILTYVFKDQILDALKPASHWLLTTPGAWAIPIGAMIVVSFPPLFGHELVALFAGMIWGAWIGFGIVCAGTFLGEITVFLAFKYYFRSYGQRAQRNSIPFAAFCRVVNKGGFSILLATRLSAIPSHFSTVVFATCEVRLWKYTIVMFLALPKQITTVLIGYDLATSANGQKSTTSNIISYVSLGLMVIITLGIMWYLRKKSAQEIQAIVYERRKKRQADELKNNHLVQPYDHDRNGSSSSDNGGHVRQDSTAHLLSTAETLDMV